MKTKTKLFLWVLALGIFFVACDKNNEYDTTPEVDNTISEEPIDNAIEMGTVSLKPSLKDVIEVKTGKAATLDEVLDALNVKIYSVETSTVIIDANYRDLPEFIELPPGNYDFIFSGASYGAEGSFIVTTSKNTKVNSEISLKSVAITINFSESIQLNYPQIYVLATISYLSDNGSANAAWGIETNGDTKIFRMDSYRQSATDMFWRWVVNKGDLAILISAKDPLTNVKIEVLKTYSGIVANEHYNITIEQTAASTAILTVTLGDEYVINETITFPN